MINVGLVGFGLSGRYLQAPFFITNPDFNLKAILTSQKIPHEFFPGTTQVNKLEDLLKDPQIDLISICSPNSTHYEFAKEALKAGKHVLVEKPMTARLSEAKDLWDIAILATRKLCIFHNRRFDSDFLTIQKLIQSEILGEIVSFEANYDRYKPELNSKSWKEEANACSGILYDLGTHLIDQAICLFGRPEHACGKTFIQRANSKIDDAFNLQLDYGKLKVRLNSSLVAKEEGPRYVINGTKGSYIKYGIDVQEEMLKAGTWPDAAGFGQESSDFNGTIKSNFRGLEISGIIESCRGNWMGLFENLAAAINGKEELTIKSEEIFWQLEIIEKIKAEHTC